jgi:hypothetical protein
VSPAGPFRRRELRWSNDRPTRPSRCSSWLGMTAPAARAASHSRRPRRRGGSAHVSLLEQLRFLTRVRVASPRQFGAAFEHDAWWAYKRIARLCDQGLADRARPLREFPAAVWATPAGLAAVGLVRSRPPRLSLDRLATWRSPSYSWTWGGRRG